MLKRNHFLLHIVISEQMYSLVLVSKFFNRLQIRPFLTNPKPPSFSFLSRLSRNF